MYWVTPYYYKPAKYTGIKKDTRNIRDTPTLNKPTLHITGIKKDTRTTLKCPTRTRSNS